MKTVKCRFVVVVALMALAAAASAGVGRGAAPQATAEGVLKLAPSLDGPLDADRPVIKAAVAVLESQHVSQRKIDDEIARRWIGLFLHHLDPAKLYFERADFEAFQRAESRLDELVRAGDARFAYVVYRVLLQRVDQRMRALNELLGETHDYDVDEWLPFDGRDLAQPADAAEARDRLRKRVKYDLLKLEAEGVAASEAPSLLRSRYDARQKQFYRISDAELVETYLRTLFVAFDPNSSYYSPLAWQFINPPASSSKRGLGLRIDLSDSICTVNAVHPGGPAQRDGRLKVGDQIVGIAPSEGSDFVDLRQRRLAEVLERMWGEKGTTVRLRVVPRGSAAPVIYELTRGDVVPPKADGQIVEETRGDGPPLKIGYLNLPGLNGKSTIDPTATTSSQDVRRLLAGFRAAKADAVVLDLRQNNGNSIEEAVEVAGLFLPQSPVLLRRSRATAQKNHIPESAATAQDSHARYVQGEEPAAATSAWHGPLVVLTGKQTLGTSEILAAALQDYGRALIVGERPTSGLGLASQSVELGPRVSKAVPPPNLGAARVTTGYMLRPSGNSILLQGVTPDLILPALTAVTRVQPTPETELSTERTERADYTRLDYSVEQSLRDELSSLSEARRGKDDSWQRIVEQMAARQRVVDSPDIPLRREAFQTWYAGSGLGEPKPEPITDPMQDPFARESIQIALDYAARLEAARAGRSFAKTRYNDSWNQYLHGLRLDPDNVDINNQIAWIMATCPDARFRNGKQAVGYAKWVQKRDQGQHWNYLLTLAVAHAEAGDFSAAKQHLSEALAAAPESRRFAYRYLETKFAAGKTYAGR